MASDAPAEAAARAEIRDYLDMLAVALAAAATWWRQQLAHHYPDLPVATLNKFEGVLCFGLATLLMRNAQQGLSWRTWKVSCHPRRTDEVLLAACKEAGLVLDLQRLHYTRMWLESTAEEVQVVVQLARERAPRQIHPAVG